MHCVKVKPAPSSPPLPISFISTSSSTLPLPRFFPSYLSSPSSPSPLYHPPLLYFVLTPTSHALNASAQLVIWPGFPAAPIIQVTNIWTQLIDPDAEPVAGQGVVARVSTSGEDGGERLVFTAVSQDERDNALREGLAEIYGKRDPENDFSSSPQRNSLQNPYKLYVKAQIELQKKISREKLTN